MQVPTTKASSSTGFARSSVGIHLLRRSAIEKHGVEHYAVGVAPEIVRQLWGDFSYTLLELTPRGVERRYPQVQEAWQVVDSATNTRAATLRLKDSLAKGVKYSLAEFNCEHFARQVVLGRRESTQVNFAIAIVLSVAALAVLMPGTPSSSC